MMGDARMQRWVGIGGLVFVALVVVTVFLLPSLPGNGASATQVAAYYHDHKSAVGVNAYLIGLAVFVGIFFFWYLRDLVATVETNRRLATIGFAGALVFAVAGAFDASIYWAAQAGVGHVEPATMQTLNVLQGPTFLTSVGIAVFLIATGIALIRSGVLAKWLGWVGVVLGVVALTLPAAFGPLPAGLWILIASIVILVGRHDAAATIEGRPIPTP
jgi:hypothetical protein